MEVRYSPKGDVEHNNNVAGLVRQFPLLISDLDGTLFHGNLVEAIVSAYYKIQLPKHWRIRLFLSYVLFKLMPRKYSAEIMQELLFAKNEYCDIFTLFIEHSNAVVVTACSPVGPILSSVINRDVHVISLCDYLTGRFHKKTDIFERLNQSGKTIYLGDSLHDSFKDERFVRIY